MLSTGPTVLAPNEILAPSPTFAPCAELRATLLDPAKRNAIFPIVTPLHHERWSVLLEEAGLLEEYEDLPKGIQYGFRSGLKTLLPHTFVPPNAQSALNNPKPIDDYLAQELSAGRISRKYSIPELNSIIGPFRTNPLGLIEKVPGSNKFRMTNNFSFPYNDPSIPSINSSIDKNDFKCGWDTFAQCYLIVARAPIGTQASVFDVAGAFRNVPLAPEERPFAAMSWHGGIYLDHVYCFGTTSAPGIFGRLADAVCKLYKFKLIDDLIKWVDDFVFFRYPSNTSSPYSYTYDTSIIWRIAADLGWPWAPEKHTPFATHFMYIGFLWDLSAKTVSLPDHKREKYLLKLSSWTFGMLATRQDAEKLTGTLNHCTLIIREGRAYLTSLYTFIASFKPTAHNSTKHRIPQRLADDISWWHDRLSNPPCTLTIKEPPAPLSAEIHVDASTSWGIGFVMNDLWLAWPLIPGWHSDERDIGWAEMVAVELALHCIVTAGHRNTHVIIRSDNQGVVGASEAGRSRNTACNLILRKIINLFHDYDLWATISWISTSNNQADGPSRGLFPLSQNLFPFPPKIPSHLTRFVSPCITHRDLSLR
jgi:hypothetical protein